MKRKMRAMIFLGAILLILAGCGDMVHDMHNKGVGVAWPVDLFGTVRSDTDSSLEDLEIRLWRNRSDTGIEPTEIIDEGGGVYSYTFLEVPQKSGYTVRANAKKHFEEISIVFSASLKTGERGELDLELGKKWLIDRLTGQEGTSGSVPGDRSTATFSAPTGLTLNSNKLYVGDKDTGYLRCIDINNVNTSTGTITWQWEAVSGSWGGGISINWGDPPDPSSAVSFDDNINFNGGLVFNTNPVGTDPFLCFVAGGADNMIYGIKRHTLPGPIDVIQIMSLAGQRNSGWADTDTVQSTSTGRERFRNPTGVALSLNGATLYVADTGNHSIRKVTTGTGKTETLAGNRSSGSQGGSQDGSGTQARFSSPQGLALSPDGSILYVADTGNNRIRTVRTSDGVTGTLPEGAGSKLQAPMGLWLDSDNDILYVSESKKVRSVNINTGAIKTVAEFEHPSSSLGGVVLDPVSGKCYVADSGRHVIWEMDKNY